ncbi:hypothetical protein U0070_016877 [Myodes glareolus]|uniref:Potassium channel tetramerisation-type BTB domain-containing protein n=1 Tax=Myodes glareolus TaxID=447135 RepID=A0AAW0IB13_MYOGA
MPEWGCTDAHSLKPSRLCTGVMQHMRCPHESAQEEMSGESVVSSAVPAAATRTTSFKGASPSSKYVKLNVGGALYYTTMQTLTKQDTMLKAMFSGRMEVLTDSEGECTCQPPAAGC